MGERRGEWEGDWAACPGCDLPVPLDDRGFFVMHLAWMEWADATPYPVECDWSQSACLDE
jgi:hypothetical protein